MKKILKYLLAFLIMVPALLIMPACGGTGSGGSGGGSSAGGGQLPATPGLTYMPIENGTAWEVSQGFDHEDTSVIKKLVIPGTYQGLPVKVVKSYGFSMYFNLQEVIIQEGVEELAQNCFYNHSLTKIQLPNSLKIIRRGAFYCSLVEEFHIPENVEVVENGIFQYSNNLKEVSFPLEPFEYGVNYNSNILNAFLDGYSNVQKITIVGNRKDIPESAFYGLEFTEFEIPNHIEEIGVRAFANCSNLVTINIPSSVNKIDEIAFEGCTSLKSITIPATVTEVNMGMFRNCKALEEITVPYFSEKMFDIRTYFDTPESEALAETYNHYYLADFFTNLKKVTVLGGNYMCKKAFYNCPTITEIVLPATLTTLSNETFFGCSGLERLTTTGVGGNTKETAFLAYNFGAESAQEISLLPANLKTITVLGGEFLSDFAFNGLRNLESVTLSNSTSYIGDDVFAGCEKLGGKLYGNAYYVGSPQNPNMFLIYAKDKNVTSVNIVGDCKVVYNEAFKETNLQSIVIPTTVTKIGDECFAKCVSLTSVQLPNTIDKIYASTFAECENINNIVIPNSVKEIEENAFKYTNSLTNITMSTGIEIIGTNAFRGCKITSIVLPNTLKIVGAGSFSFCSNLTDFEIPSSVETMGEAVLEGSASLISLSVPFIGETVEDYEEGQFKDLFDGDTSNLVPTSLKTITVTKATERLSKEAFMDCTVLETIIILNAKGIGYSAFNGCTSLATCIIGEGTTYIEHSAFKNCTSLTDVQLPSTLGALHNNVFENCVSLETITLPSGFNGCGEGVFKGASKLHTLTIPATGEQYLPRYWGFDYRDRETNVNPVPNLKKVVLNGGTTIGKYYFYNMTSIEELIVSDTVSRIDDEVFCGTDIKNSYTYENGVYFGNKENNYVVYLKPASTELESIVVHPNCKAINARAFKNLTKLSSVSLPEDLKIIPYNLFENCSSLTTISLPETITYVYSYAFYGCNVEELHFTENLTEFQENALRGVNNLKEITIPFIGKSPTETTKLRKTFGAIFGHDTYLDYEPHEEDFVLQYHTSSGTQYMYYIPKTLRTINVTNVQDNTISDAAFANCDFVTTINLPNGITNVEYEAFLNCSQIETLNLGDSVTEYGYFAFKNCEKLKNMKFSLNAESVGISAFENTSLENIVMGDSVTKISQRAFANNLKLESFVVGGNVTEIGKNAFENNPLLQDITFNNKLEIIDEYAFSGCVGLQDFVLPQSLAKICAYAFQNCESMTTVNVPENVTELGNFIFYNCKKLTSATLPNNITKIPAGIFSDCALTTFDFSDNVTEIGYSAFKNCNLTDFSIVPERIQYINSETFAGNDFEEVVISKNVLRISGQAFMGCTKLKYVYFPETLEYIGVGALQDCSSIETVYLPFIGTTLEDKAGKADEDNVAEFTVNYDEIHRAIFGYYKSRSETPPEGYKTRYTETVDFITYYYQYYVPTTLKNLIVFNIAPDASNEFGPHTVENLYTIITEDCTSIPAKTPYYATYQGYDKYFYMGDEAGFAQIENMPEYVTEVYYYKEDITGLTEGNYWHFVDNIPVIWQFETV